MVDNTSNDPSGSAAAPEKEGGKSNLNLSADELKEEGNRCVKAGNFTEAVLHYTHAIKLSPADPILYSNRSLAFLKQQQYYYANEDADRAIGLNPAWAKGYFRKAEVHMATSDYDTALLSYGKALQLQPQDMGIIQAARKAADLSNRDVEQEKRMPAMGAGVGCVVGMCIVMADMMLAEKPTIRYTSLMVLVVLVVAAIGFGIAKSIRYYTKLQRKGLLDPPLNLLEDFLPTKDEDSENGGPNEPKPPRTGTRRPKLGSGSKRAKHNNTSQNDVTQAAAENDENALKLSS